MISQPTSCGVSSFGGNMAIANGMGIQTATELTPLVFTQAYLMAIGAQLSRPLLMSASNRSGSPDPAKEMAADEAESAGTAHETGPIEPYNRAKHYRKTPTQADREAIGAGKGQVADHDPPLVKRYYNGDPATGERPGHTMTSAERHASASDRSRMKVQSQEESNKQGWVLSQWSKRMRKMLGLE
jgi:hypothetical protein